jgi:hypothetical protein
MQTQFQQEERDNGSRCSQKGARAAGHLQRQRSANRGPATPAIAGQLGQLMTWVYPKGKPRLALP